MARRKKETVSEMSPKDSTEVESLREYAAEAEQVELLLVHPGWMIVSENIKAYRKQIGEKIAYLQPETKEFKEARITYIACDKVLKIVEDYIENKKRVLELLAKIDNPQENIILDVDSNV